MDMHPQSRVGADTSVIQDSGSALRLMTSEQLLGLGMNQVVYLKSGTCDGRTLFVLFGADGTPVVVADDVEAAVETALEQGLSFVALH